MYFRVALRQIRLLHHGRLDHVDALLSHVELDQSLVALVLVLDGFELILVKHWASYTAIPIFIVDADGNLAYYNESAEQIIGRSFDEAGEIQDASAATQEQIMALAVG